MRQHPIPVIVLSAHTAGNKELALKAFENGAMYVMNKPEVENRKSFEEYSVRLRELIKMAAVQSDIQKTNLRVNSSQSVQEIDNDLAQYSSFLKNRPEVIAIGASAGGTIAIQTILSQINGNPPPILITQHMPAGFTEEFA